jgi:hypothetical protein
VKLTQARLRQIIKEELSHALKEGRLTADQYLDRAYGGYGDDELRRSQTAAPAKRRSDDDKDSDDDKGSGKYTAADYERDYNRR